MEIYHNARNNNPRTLRIHCLIPVVLRIYFDSSISLQVALQQPPQYACGCLFLLSEVLKARPPVWYGSIHTHATKLVFRLYKGRGLGGSFPLSGSSVFIIDVIYFPR